MVAFRPGMLTLYFRLASGQWKSTASLQPSEEGSAFCWVGNLPLVIYLVIDCMGWAYEMMDTMSGSALEFWIGIFLLLAGFSIKMAVLNPLKYQNLVDPVLNVSASCDQTATSDLGLKLRNCHL